MAKTQARHSTKERYTVREMEVMELRRKGWAFKDIANKLGISIARTYALFSRAIEKYTADAAETVAEVTAMDLARLDKMMVKHLEKAEAGDGDATEKVLKIMDRKAKLLGLDKQSDKTIKVQWEALLAEGLE